MNPEGNGPEKDSDLDFYKNLSILLSFTPMMETTFFFMNRSFDENGSYNPGKEIKAETQTYYQGLIDNRDSPFVVSFQLHR